MSKSNYTSPVTASIRGVVPRGMSTERIINDYGHLVMPSRTTLTQSLEGQGATNVFIHGCYAINQQLPAFGLLVRFAYEEEGPLELPEFFEAVWPEPRWREQYWVWYVQRRLK